MANILLTTPPNAIRDSAQYQQTRDDKPQTEYAAQLVYWLLGS